MKICTQCKQEHPDAWCDFKPGIGWVCFDCLADMELNAEKELNNINCFYCGKSITDANDAKIILEGVVHKSCNYGNN